MQSGPDGRTSTGPFPGLSETPEIAFDPPERYNASAILFDNLAAGRHDRIAVTGPAGTQTYAVLCSEAARYGHALLALGLQHGDRVLLFLDDTPAYPAAVFGALRAGLVPLLINTLTPPDLLQFYLEDSQARVAVSEAGFATRFDATACRNTRLETLVVVNGASPNVSPVPTIEAAAWLARHPCDLVCAATGRDDMAFWMYSSGSTGRPKGIVHRQRDMAFTHLSYAQHVLKLTPDDICFSIPKIFFAYGFGNSLTFPFSVGASSVLMPGQPKAGAIAACLDAYKPTVLFGVPTLYNALVNAAEMQAADLSSLRLSISAAEALSLELSNAWKALSGLDLIEGLGSTEVLHIYLSNTAEARKVGTAGLRVPGYELLLRDRDDRDVADGEEGMLWVRGASSARTYWNRPEKTATTMRDDGWLFTGDRLVRDTDGFHTFRGRADDLVKVSGQWVYPLEVELCLCDHPAVRECAVLALELPDRRMTIKAFVVMHDQDCDPDATASALQTHVKQTLLPYKYPRIVTFMAALPKTGTDKIDRQALARLSPPQA